MGRHRAVPVRPRYGRIATLTSSLAVTVVAVLGGAGVLGPGTTAASSAGGPVRAIDPAATTSSPSPDSSSASPTSDPAAEQPADGSADTASAEPAGSRPGAARAATDDPDAAADPDDPDAAADPDDPDDTALPPGSGTGRRVVFSEGRQRVWLVEARGEVVRTYLVSGSVYDNLDPGTYAVYSRSEQAYGIDDSGTMRYFVRFTQGENAAIGFHDIPVDDGEQVQTLDQLGTPQSHGCIRQRRADARALWDFAPLGTTVVVTA